MLDAKLQIKPDRTVALVDAPFSPSLEAPPAEPETADAVLVFVGDRGALAWVAYPKARQRGTDLGRDAIHAWTEGKGLDAVRQVAIDAVWSAMRLKAV